MNSSQTQVRYQGTAGQDYPGNSGIARLLGCFLLFGVPAFPGPAQGRFSPSDAALIDLEDKLNSEYYNDILSYRYPFYWESAWQRADLGYRSSYGSLDIRRFYTQEDIRLRHQVPGRPGFGFTQIRRETINEILVQQEVRLSVPLGETFHLALLGDGGTLKKWGDLGVAVTVGVPTDVLWLDLNYWSVDHYYNSKVETDQNRYVRETYTVIFRGHFRPRNSLQGEFFLEYDSPLDWARGSTRRRYYRQQTSARVAVEAPLPADSWTAKLSLWSERKTEKVSLSQDEQQWNNGLYYLKKNLQRNTKGAEFGGTLQSAGREHGYYVGVWSVRRLADYRQEPADPPDPLPDEGEEYSHDSDRREWALLLLQAQSYENFPDFLWGFHYNRIAWDDDTSLRKGELKLQTALDVLIADRIHLLINCTWDLDEVYRERRKSFRPWGGGNLQIQAVF